MDMGMDEAVAKPENNGLPRNWSAMMMGMMTLVRVLPRDLYDLVMNDLQRGYVAPLPPVGEHPPGERDGHYEQHQRKDEEGREGGSR